MGNCTVTQFNGTYNDPSLRKVGEVVLTVASPAGATDRYFAIRTKASATTTIRSLDGSNILSSDGNTYASSISVSTDNVNNANIYINTNGKYKDIAISNGYNLFLVCSLSPDTSSVYISNDDGFKYSEFITALRVSTEKIELTDLPNLLSLQRPFGSITAFRSGNNFTTLTFDKQKNTFTNIPEITNSMFESLSMCVDFLESMMTATHYSYSNTSNIQFDQTWNTVVPLSDSRLDAYRQKIYDALVYMLRDVLPIKFTNYVLFGVTYTYDTANNKLLANGVPVEL